MAVVTVDTTADNIAFDNDVTLREAILFVNGTLGYGSLSAGEQALVDLTEPLGTNDTIRFNIPGSGVQTISPTSALPDVRAKVLIDGYSQPGASANTLAVGNDATLLIELDGNGAGATDSGLVFDVGSDGSTVRGMVINRFEDAGVLTINTENITIAGNFIGTDPTGTLDRGNDRGVALAYTSGATIGGSAAADRNVISGNDTDGIQIFDDDGNFVYGNYIGTNAAGTGAIANDENGVSITSRENVVGGTAAGAGNLISGNGLNGIALADGDSDSAERTLIQGNIIGLASDGTALGNGKSGISMTLNTIDNVVGGTIAGARNVISGNLESGISLEESTRNTIQGNFIGTNLAGDATIGNTQYGIVLNESDNTVIGGLAAGAGNVITGNRLDGIALGSSSFTTIQGNRIGVFATGTTGSGNGGNGVLISEDSRDNQIGGAVSAAANIIAFNEAAGVNIFTYQGDAERNVIRRNSIHSNGGLGIDFTGIISGGITPNDPMDGDGGSNNQQNFPVLVSAVASASGLNIVGTFNSLPNTTFILEFFSNTALDPSGMGEGERYLGSVGVITDAAGNASFNTTLAVTLGSDVYISATATNTTTSPYGDTSEFAQSIEAVLPPPPPPPPSVSIDDVTKNEGNSGTTAFTFTLTRTGDLTNPSIVSVSTANGTANASDYTSQSGTLVAFLAGQSTATVTINVAGDTAVEGDDTFSVNVAGVSNATVGDGEGLGTIKNDDVALPPPPAGATITVKDVCGNGKTSLVVTGTNASETIDIAYAGMQGKATVKINGVNKGTFTFTDGVVVYGQGGNDKVTVSSSITRYAALFGGEGNDTLTAGGGSALLLGERGNDSLKGGAKRDILIGGDGYDNLDGGSDEDVVIGGFTTADDSVCSLLNMLKEWTRTDKNYATRVSNLRNGAGYTGGAKFSESTVKADNHIDTLKGNGGTDLFYAATSNGSGRKKDVLSDKGGSETLVVCT